MITLIHGNQTEASRTQFLALKARGGEQRELEGGSVDAQALTQALESSSLFDQETHVYIENLFTKLGRKQKLMDSLTSILKASSADIVLWEGKEVSAAAVRSLGTPNVQLHKIPSSLFQFLDSPTLASYQKLTEQEPPELVFALLVKRLRQLIQIRDGTLPTGMQTWSAAKLTRQAKSFTMEKLKEMYIQLLDIEYSVKTGSSPFTLKQLTEQFLIHI